MDMESIVSDSLLFAYTRALEDGYVDPTDVGCMSCHT